MANPIIKVIDLKTGDEVERPMTPEEFADYKKSLELQKTQQLEIEEKEAARQSALEKLAALGLTEAEIRALAG